MMLLALIVDTVVGQAKGVMELGVTDVGLLAFALSFHSIFEGLPIGLQDTVAAVWSTLASLAVHKATPFTRVQHFVMSIHDNHSLFPQYCA
jgi:hypothetical protein